MEGAKLSARFRDFVPPSSCDFDTGFELHPIQLDDCREVDEIQGAWALEKKVLSSISGYQGFSTGPAHVCTHVAGNRTETFLIRHGVEQGS